MTLEDFTTFTEQDDTGDHIQEPTATHVDAKLYQGSTYKAILYKDYGADHFGTVWEHKIDFKLISVNITESSVLALVTTIKGSQLYIINNLGYALGFISYMSGATHYVAIREYYNGSLYTSSTSTIPLDTWRYLTLKRDGTAFTCKIYSDSARTVLLATLSLTLQAAHPSHRYYEPCLESEGGTSGRWGNYDVENLDLQEGAPPETKKIMVDGFVSIVS